MPFILYQYARYIKEFTRLLAGLLLSCVLLTTSVAETGQQPDTRKYEHWIAQFKASSRGPFKQIRWYCNDGAVLPPIAGACVSHGGGIQHGEWNAQTRQLRDAGFYLGNVLAAVDVAELTNTLSGKEMIHQILLERYLMATDDGWIFRGARYYRGALQIEDEMTSARRLLVTIARTGKLHSRNYLLLRTAAKYLAHKEHTADVARVRTLSTQLGDEDPGFEKLRNKIHAQPDADDAARVREYRQLAAGKYQQQYAQLADDIDAVYQGIDLQARLVAVIRTLDSRPVADEIHKALGVFTNTVSPRVRLQTAARLLQLLRDEADHLTTSAEWLDVLDASLALEQQVFIAGAELRGQLADMTRRQRLQLLREFVVAMYGTGELDQRQWQSLLTSLQELDSRDMGLTDYRKQLRYLARLSHWVDRGYQFHFSQSIQKLAAIEPLVNRFIPDQLRGGPVLHYSAILDGLIIDADRLAQVQHRIFGTGTGSGIRMLNPGIARGVLKRVEPSDRHHKLQENGIYVLPDTTAELTPVAGILTRGEGNALSHVQILARNLGIPNVHIAESLLPVLEPYANQNIVMAVSPGGRVILARDGPQWDVVFGRTAPLNDEQLRVDPNKLDLSFTQLLTLDNIRASDAGRIAGPKAANLGELRHHFPDNVPQGIVIPFGVFRAMLQQPVDDSGQSVSVWMQAAYRQLQTLQGRAYERQRDVFLQKLQQWILHSDPGSEFRDQLELTLQQQLGNSSEFSLFVRSDTNVEDLPGFSGAGLNLTVPNVQGFENLVMAIKRVWASPFTKRAFAWRQQRMQQPQHVYVSVLLMPSVAVDKSGVMVTTDINNEEPGWVTIAVNEGVGGAVGGEAAEELRLNAATGNVQLLAEATAPLRRVLKDDGGIAFIPVSGNAAVLTQAEIGQLRQFAETLSQRYPMVDDQGQATAIDVEFGFNKGKLVLFQARPYLASRRAMQSQYLHELDKGLRATLDHRVNLEAVPLE